MRRKWSSSRKRSSIKLRFQSPKIFGKVCWHNQRQEFAAKTWKRQWNVSTNHKDPQWDIPNQAAVARAVTNHPSSYLIQAINKKFGAVSVDIGAEVNIITPVLSKRCNPVSNMLLQPVNKTTICTYSRQPFILNLESRRNFRGFL